MTTGLRTILQKSPLFPFFKGLYHAPKTIYYNSRKILLYPFRSIHPVSRKFGSDRGTPIVRYYIKDFLSKNSSFISGSVLEMSEALYTKKYGTSVTRSEVLHLTEDNPHATLIKDLAEIESLPENMFDCFVCTQTFQFIYDINTAIRGSYKMLKPGGVLLATINGISQISRYDMDKWGEYWRMTILAAEKAFTDVYGENVTVDFYGNCLSSISALRGLSSQELTQSELNYKDPDYQFLITVVAKKPIHHEK